MANDIQSQASGVSPWVGVVGTLSGVAIGFILTTVKEWMKEKGKKDRLHKALKEELNSNLHMLPQKLALMREYQTLISNNQRKDMRSIPFMTDVYRSETVNIAVSIKHSERHALHIIYDSLEQIDVCMDLLSQRARREDPSSTVGQYVAQRNLEGIFSKTIVLIRGYLDGRLPELEQNSAPLSY